MPQRKSQGTDDQDPGQQLREESNQERREEDENSGRGSLMEELDRLWHAVGERS